MTKLHYVSKQVISMLFIFTFLVSSNTAYAKTSDNASLINTILGKIEELTKKVEQLENNEEGIIFYDYSTDVRTLKLQAYWDRFERRRPAYYHAADFVEAADKYGHDWTTVAAFAQMESTGFLYGAKEYDAQGNLVAVNSFGWAAYGYSAPTAIFDSHRDEIFTIAWNLAGKNPNTVKYYGPQFTLKQKAEKWNNINKNYYNELMAVSSKMKSMDVSDKLATIHMEKLLAEA